MLLKLLIIGNEKNIWFRVVNKIPLPPWNESKKCSRQNVYSISVFLIYSIQLILSKMHVISTERVLILQGVNFSKTKTKRLNSINLLTFQGVLLLTVLVFNRMVHIGSSI